MIDDEDLFAWTWVDEAELRRLRKEVEALKAELNELQRQLTRTKQKEN